MPVSLKDFFSSNKNKVLKLKKALYSLKQTQRGWYNKIDFFFLKTGFDRSINEPTL